MQMGFSKAKECLLALSKDGNMKEIGCKAKWWALGLANGLMAHSTKGNGKTVSKKVKVSSATLTGLSTKEISLQMYLQVKAKRFIKTVQFI